MNCEFSNTWKYNQIFLCHWRGQGEVLRAGINLGYWMLRRAIEWTWFLLLIGKTPVLILTWGGSKTRPPSCVVCLPFYHFSLVIWRTIPEVARLYKKAVSGGCGMRHGRLGQCRWYSSPAITTSVWFLGGYIDMENKALRFLEAPGNRLLSDLWQCLAHGQDGGSAHPWVSSSWSCCPGRTINTTPLRDTWCQQLTL